ncbi:aminotransferase class I/II-fold pyridoxal phosphate-dependent enzyme [Pokkaliibacter sp. CJK22405]|uniref:aminotransferase class I/II-fold pyridoxal phosphate-dependent enzyme n=1 Tax=Pokkaliibacter sp. CJK22405 TaxID=3384615 RepID=UPI0039856A5A
MSLKPFALEEHFARWEFTARYHLCASDAESIYVQDLLTYATDDERMEFDELWLGYTETRGAPELREAISATYENINDDQVVCCTGAQEAIYIAMKVLLAEGDHAIVMVPNYQSAETLPLERCEVTGVSLRQGNEWKLDLQGIREAIKPNTRLISINFPNNPTGMLISKDELDALVSLCREHGIWLFSDEVYRGLELDESLRLPQVADIYERGISLNVMSKSYGLPGLRLGWVACQDEALLEKMVGYKHYLSISNSAPSERLTIMALNQAERLLSRNREIIEENLELLDEFFAGHTDLFEWTRPQGGCVAYPRYLGSNGVDDFCERLVNEVGVLLLPGSLYASDLLDAPVDHFRIGCGREELEKGLMVMEAFINKNKAQWVS